MTVKTRGEMMVEALSRLNLRDIDEPLIGRPSGPVLRRFPFEKPAARPAQVVIPATTRASGSFVQMSLPLTAVAAYVAVIGTAPIPHGVGMVLGATELANIVVEPLSYSVDAQISVEHPVDTLRVPGGFEPEPQRPEKAVYERESVATA